jgi:hypothetical protein
MTSFCEDGIYKLDPMTSFCEDGIYKLYKERDNTESSVNDTGR